MGLKTDCTATIKSVENKGKYSVCRIVINAKDKETDTFYCAFGGYASFIGDAHSASPREGQRIRIKEFDVSNGYFDRFEKTQKWNDRPKVTIFKYELVGASAEKSVSPPIDGFGTESSPFGAAGDTDLPF
jgi:hypothetical protein